MPITKSSATSYFIIHVLSRKNVGIISKSDEYSKKMKGFCSVRENPENTQMATKLFSRRVLMAARSSASLKAASEGCVLTAATSARASEGCRRLRVSQAWQHMKLQGGY